MRNLAELDRYRLNDKPVPDPRFEGRFMVPITAEPTQIACLKIIACSGGGWDHVSVSLPDRVPTWDEMERVKRLFFRDDETAMQLHVPVSEHINKHPFVLHLWRPHSKLRRIPRPPGWMV